MPVLIPVNGFVLARKVSSSGEIVEELGIRHKKEAVDIYEIVSISEPSLTRVVTGLELKAGDLVTSCATGTETGWQDTILLDPKYITSKVLNNGQQD